MEDKINLYDVEQDIPLEIDLEKTVGVLKETGFIMKSTEEMMEKWLKGEIPKGTMYDAVNENVKQLKKDCNKAIVKECLSKKLNLKTKNV
jgi:hypothetical protein